MAMTGVKQKVLDDLRKVMDSYDEHLENTKRRKIKQVVHLQSGGIIWTVKGEANDEKEEGRLHQV